MDYWRRKPKRKRKRPEISWSEGFALRAAIILTILAILSFFGPLFMLGLQPGHDNFSDRERVIVDSMLLGVILLVAAAAFWEYYSISSRQD